MREAILLNTAIDLVVWYPKSTAGEIVERAKYHAPNLNPASVATVLSIMFKHRYVRRLGYGGPADPYRYYVA